MSDFSRFFLYLIKTVQQNWISYNLCRTFVFRLTGKNWNVKFLRYKKLAIEEKISLLRKLEYILFFFVYVMLLGFVLLFVMA